MGHTHPRSLFPSILRLLVDVGFVNLLRICLNLFDRPALVLDASHREFDRETQNRANFDPLLQHVHARARAA